MARVAYGEARTWPRRGPKRTAAEAPARRRSSPQRHGAQAHHEKPRTLSFGGSQISLLPSRQVPMDSDVTLARRNSMFGEATWELDPKRIDGHHFNQDRFR